MSTTEEYLDGLLQETMGQKESDAKTAQPDITKEEKNAVPADAFTSMRLLIYGARTLL